MKTIYLFAILILALNAKIFAQDTIVITKTTDPDMFQYPYNYIDSLCDPEMYGTLQWAFRKAADSPAETVYIIFNIPGVGPHVISLNYGLPQLGRKVVIDGASQPGYQPGSPSVIIDGNGNFNVGISLYSADSNVVNGLCLRNFRYNGILCNRVNNSRFTGNVIYNITRMLYDLLLGEGAIGFLSSSDNLITGNIIGTDQTGNTYNNKYAGINIQKIPSDRIATPPSYGNITGTVTPGEGNTITSNGNFGILVGQDCYSNRISGNQIYNNNKAIYLAPATFPSVSGNYDKLAPEITTFNGNAASGISDPDDIIEIFGSTGNENADEYLTSVNADSSGNWSATINTSFDYILATATDASNNTSVLSGAFQKQVIPGSTCNNPVISLSGTADTSYTYIIPGNELWIKLSVDSGNTLINILPVISGTISNVAIYDGSCNQLNELYNKQDTLSFIFSDSLSKEYFIQINGIDSSGIQLFVVKNIEEHNVNWIPYDCAQNNCGNNLIVNGEFDDIGSTGFPVGFSISGTYTYQIPCVMNISPGRTTVASNAGTQVHWSWMGIHPSGINNQFFAVDTHDGGIANYFWNETINVTPGQTYEFKGWFRNPNQVGFTNAFIPRIYININGQDIISNVGIPRIDVATQWYQICFTWTPIAGVNQADIKFYTNQPCEGLGCDYGNDFLIDGLTFWETISPITISVSSIQNSTCCNGSVTLSATGGSGGPYTYQWPGQPSNSTGQFNNLCPGIYTVTVTDGFSCSQTYSVVIDAIPFNVNIGVYTQPSCPVACNGIIYASVLNPLPGISYTYQWSNGSSSETVYNLCPGDYTVTVTSSEGCTTIQTTSLYFSDFFTASITHTNSCIGEMNGTATVLPDLGIPPYSYLWNNPSPQQTSQTCTGLAPGIWTVTIIDANGCTTTASVNIMQDNLTVTTSQSSSSLCVDDVINIYINAVPHDGTSPYTYLWSNGGATTSNINVSNPQTTTTYTVTVIDANGCSETASATVTVLQLAPQITSIVNPACSGQCNGSVTINETNGSGLYEIYWNRNNVFFQASIGVTLPFTLTGLCAGNYTAQVFNSNCDVTIPFTITQPAQLSGSVTAQASTCPGHSDGSATVTASGGTPANIGPPFNYHGYNFAWSNGTDTYYTYFSYSSTMTGLSAGTWTVTVTDAHSCSTVVTVVIGGFPAFNLSLTQTQLISCSGGNNGSVSATVTGSTSPYSYLWSNGQTTNSISGLTAGNYTVTVTDANNCTQSADIIINNPPQISANAITSDAQCNGDNTGTIYLDVSGGVSGYSYLWSDGSATNPIFTYAGNYSVTITDANGCTFVVSNMIVSEPPPISVSLSSTNNSLCPGSYGNGSITITNITGGTPGYTYYWFNGQQTSTVNNLSAGTYTVTVYDAYSCSATATATIINSYPPVVISATTTESDPCICTGTINLTVSPGGCSYLWSNGATTEDLQNLCLGSYTVTVTSPPPLSCTTTASYSITAPTGTFTPLPGLTLSGDNYIITSNYALNGPATYQIPGNIIVMPGAEFHVDYGTTIKFMLDKGIYLSKNTKLFVENGSKLTSLCDILWWGIYASSPDNPIKIKIKGGTIENAKYGIYADRAAWVESSGSFYYNNYVDIFLNNTATNNPLNPYHNITGINLFETNIPQLLTNDPNFLYPYAHLITNNAWTNQIHTNNFKNMNAYLAPVFDINNRGMGILNYGTKLNIYDSYFEGLKYGIKSHYSSTFYNNDFAKNNRGIFVSGTNSTGTDVYGNTFDVGGTNYGYDPSLPDPTTTLNWGVGIYNCTAFDVYENTFNDGLIGVIANFYDPTGGNVIYNNEFNNMYAGIVSANENNILFNCNRFDHNQPQLTYGQFQAFEGGDMVIYNGQANIFQKHWFYSVPTSTFNKVLNTNCTLTNNSLKFFNNTTIPYHYLFNINNDNITDIRNCDQTNDNIGGVTEQDGLFLNYNSNINFYCPNGDPGGNKSMVKGFITADSLSGVKEYQNNVLQSLTDNGNTDQFLASIAVLAPNNFTSFFNQLMAASPYLSDTVLISFMIHPINKPAQKKAVVLANSPLPYRVRPYIDQMNVNQNFKNQMWAAQHGSLNARVNLENYISWLGSRRQSEINFMSVKCTHDTLGYITDSLINYLGNSYILDERVIRYSLLMKKSDYNNALGELPVINGLTGELSFERQSEYADFANVSEIMINAIQLPDSAGDSLILANRSYLESIANTDFHVAQYDAKALLEKAGITQDYKAYLPDGLMARSFRIPSENKSEVPGLCESLVIYPNPSSGNMLVKYDLGGEEGISEIRLTATDGKIINTFLLPDQKGEIRINCNTCITGNYILTLLVDGNIFCTKELNIKK